MAEHLANGNASVPADVIMKEEPSTEAAMDGIQQADPTDPQQPPPPPVAIAPAPARPAAAVPTPPSVSGAATNRPGSMPPAPSQLPTKPIPHGGPTRQYLNMNVTPHLLEGMKWLAANEPEKPLQWLADFLKRRSEEVEGA